jgi:hypothetical protein
MKSVQKEEGIPSFKDAMKRASERKKSRRTMVIQSMEEATMAVVVRVQVEQDRGRGRALVGA